jgi:hypothetical protein
VPEATIDSTGRKAGTNCRRRGGDLRGAQWQEVFPSAAYVVGLVDPVEQFEQQVCVTIGGLVRYICATAVAMGTCDRVAEERERSVQKDAPGTF